MLQEWQAKGVGLVLIQGFPPSYAQYAEQRDQMRTCATAGMPFDCYVYDYLGSPDWLSGALDGLDQVLLPSEKPRMVWLDEEDVETEAGWTTTARVNAISNSIAAVKQRGYRVGIYGAAWWWTPKTGGFKGFSDYPLWAAQYDNIADASVFTPFGGWTECRIKQYAGSQPDGTDLDVLSAAEEAELNGDLPVDDTERAEMQAKIDGLATTVADIADRLGDQLLAECKRASVRKGTVRSIVAQMESERAAAVGPRP